jgi:hypothetical protein
VPANLVSESEGTWQFRLPRLLAVSVGTL